MQEFGPNGTGKAKGSIMSFQSTNLEAGCGCIFDREDGPYFEYTLGVTNMQDGTFEVFGVNLSENILRQFGHVLVDRGLDTLLRTLGVLRTVWVQKAKGTLQQRAECILDIAAVFGWDVIDEEPYPYTREELAARWFDECLEEGPVTSASLDDRQLLCSELLVALHSVAQVKYWSLMSGNFPVIPSEAFKDWRSVWWQQHGESAVAKIVSTIEQVCPPAFEFSLRQNRYGFWKRDKLGHGPNATESGSTSSG